MKLSNFQNLRNLVDRLCAAKDHYELQQGGAALLEEVRSNRELKKQNIQEKIDMLKKEKNIALSKVCASAIKIYIIHSAFSGHTFHCMSVCVLSSTIIPWNLYCRSSAWRRR